MARKKKQQLEGFIQSGLLFIGDPQYMGDNPQLYPGGIIPQDVTNPFKDFTTFSDLIGGADTNLELPDSFRTPPIGRGCVVQLQQLNGKYSISKKLDKVTGKVKSITIKLHE